MALKQVLIDVGTENINKLKSFLDDLELQMALGKMEAKDAFEEEKKSFTRFIQKEKEHLKNLEVMAAEHRTDLREKFEKLEETLAKPFATNKRSFDKDKKEALTAIYQVEDIMKKAYGDVNYSIQKELDGFKAKLDTYRVQLALGTYKDEEALKTRKVELQDAIGTIRGLMKSQDEKEGKLENFVEEVNASFEHMKKAFSDLFA